MANMSEDFFQSMECAKCGISLQNRKSFKWGKNVYCPDCYEMICPSFDQEKNLKETTEAYLEMKERFLGRKVKDICNEKKRIDIDFYSRKYVYYYLDITVNKNGIITDLSRLNAIELPGRHASLTEGRPYPVEPIDYSTTVDVIFEDDVSFED